MSPLKHALALAIRRWIGCEQCPLTSSTTTPLFAADATVSEAKSDLESPSNTDSRPAVLQAQLKRDEVTGPIPFGSDLRRKHNTAPSPYFLQMFRIHHKPRRAPPSYRPPAASSTPARRVQLNTARFLDRKPQPDSGIQDRHVTWCSRPYLTTISRARFTCSGRYAI